MSAVAALRLLGYAALAYVLAVGALAAGQRLLVFPGAWIERRPVLPAPVGFVEAPVMAKDGTRIRALWKAPKPGAGVVLTFHGNGDAPTTEARRFGTGQWAADGWGVLAVGYRGYPGSTGSPTGRDMATDALDAYDAVARLAPGAPVLVHGHSMGGWSATNVAASRPVVAAYLEAPFLSLLAMVRHVNPYLPAALLLRDPMRSDLLAPRVVVPVAIVHGTADAIVPQSQGRALAKTFPKGSFESVEGAGHDDVAGIRDATYEPYFETKVTPAQVEEAPVPGAR